MISATLDDRPARDSASAAPQLEALRARLAGGLITPASADFDAARTVPIIAVARRLLAIVRAANAQDVAEAMRFARDHALPLAVRGGYSRAFNDSVLDDRVPR